MIKNNMEDEKKHVCMGNSIRTYTIGCISLTAVKGVSRKDQDFILS